MDLFFLSSTFTTLAAMKHPGMLINPDTVMYDDDDVISLGEPDDPLEFPSDNVRALVPLLSFLCQLLTIAMCLPGHTTAAAISVLGK